MEKARFGTVLRSRWTRVDLPEPEGAEMMNTVVIPRLSFQIESLFADFFDGGLGAERQLRDAQPKIAQPAGFREDGVGLAIQLLQQKVEALAHFAAGLQNFIHLARVNLQARDLFADIAPVGY